MRFTARVCGPCVRSATPGDVHDLDEIATGFGRTGELFAADHARVAARHHVCRQALTGGYLTLAAALCTAGSPRPSVPVRPAAHWHTVPTFMANPLACAVAVALHRPAPSTLQGVGASRRSSRTCAGLEPLRTGPGSGMCGCSVRDGVMQLGTNPSTWPSRRGPQWTPGSGCGRSATSFNARARPSCAPTTASPPSGAGIASAATARRRLVSAVPGERAVVTTMLPCTPMLWWSTPESHAPTQVCCRRPYVRDSAAPLINPRLQRLPGPERPSRRHRRRARRHRRQVERRIDVVAPGVRYHRPAHGSQNELADFLRTPASSLVGYLASVGAVTALAGRGNSSSAATPAHRRLRAVAGMSRCVVDRGDQGVRRCWPNVTEPRALVVTDSITARSTVNPPDPRTVMRRPTTTVPLLVDEAHALGVRGPAALIWSPNAGWPARRISSSPGAVYRWAHRGGGRRRSVLRGHHRHRPHLHLRCPAPQPGRRGCCARRSCACSLHSRTIPDRLRSFTRFGWPPLCSAATPSAAVISLIVGDPLALQSPPRWPAAGAACSSGCFRPPSVGRTLPAAADRTRRPRWRWPLRSRPATRGAQRRCAGWGHRSDDPDGSSLCPPGRPPMSARPSPLPRAGRGLTMSVAVCKPVQTGSLPGEAGRPLAVIERSDLWSDHDLQCARYPRPLARRPPPDEYGAEPVTPGGCRRTP